MFHVDNDFLVLKIFVLRAEIKKSELRGQKDTNKNNQKTGNLNIRPSYVLPVTLNPQNYYNFPSLRIVTKNTKATDNEKLFFIFKMVF
jgi:hypothetical protein